MTPEQISEVADGNADEVIAVLDDMSADDIKSLLDVEKSGKKRKGVTEAAELKLMELEDAAKDPTSAQDDPERDEAAGGTDATTEDTAAPEAGKEARGEEVPDWKKPEYMGPMTGEIALWRLEHLNTK